MDDDDSVARQEEHARRLWQAQEQAQEEDLTPEQLARIEKGDLLRQCREALGLDHFEAATGPLGNVVAARHLRRVEQGFEDVPPKAWDAYARVLHQIGQDDLVAQIAAVCSEAKR
jgi:hypothetical protein